MILFTPVLSLMDMGMTPSEQAGDSLGSCTCDLSPTLHYLSRGPVNGIIQRHWKTMVHLARGQRWVNNSLTLKSVRRQSFTALSSRLRSPDLAQMYLIQNNVGTQLSLVYTYLYVLTIFIRNFKNKCIVTSLYDALSPSILPLIFNAHKATNLINHFLANLE